MASEITDGIDSRYRPQETGRQTKKRAQRFCTKCNWQAWYRLGNPDTWVLSSENRREKGQNQEKEDAAGKEADCFPKIRPSTCQRDQYGRDKRYQND